MVNSIKAEEEVVQSLSQPFCDKSDYSVTIDPSRTFEEMIEVGNYDWVHDNITEDDFSTEGMGRGKHKLIITLFHCDQNMHSDDVIVEMDRQGYQPAKIEHLLALGELHLFSEERFPIIAFGSTVLDEWGVPGVPHIAYVGSTVLDEWGVPHTAFDRKFSKRVLGQNSRGATLHVGCRFAAVKKGSLKR